MNNAFVTVLRGHEEVLSQWRHLQPGDLVKVGMNADWHIVCLMMLLSLIKRCQAALIMLCLGFLMKLCLHYGVSFACYVWIAHWALPAMLGLPIELCLTLLLVPLYMSGEAQYKCMAAFCCLLVTSGPTA